MATVAVALAPGATNGPIDMSVTVNFYAVEAGIFVAQLDPVDPSTSLRSRMLSAEASCESQGSTTFQMTLNPLEQGLLVGCISNTNGQFASSLLNRLQAAIISKLAALNAPTGLS